MPYSNMEPTASKNKTVSIPEPPSLPWLGNVGEFRSEDSVQDLLRLHDIYGDIYRLRFPEGKSYIMVGSNKLVNEVCDESRFQKSLKSELHELRHLANDGLFTAKGDEENWGVAHRILMPLFGPVAVRGMFDEMHDVVSQLAFKWARHGPSTPISATEDFTRLALDTIALCSMDFRFNSFYKDSLHPFVNNMVDVLTEAGKRYSRPALAQVFYRAASRKFFRDIENMRYITDDIIRARKSDPDNKKKDLLSAMMHGVDPNTGRKMSDGSITDNLITFLIAGHETTSGTLSFFFYEILKHPECFQRAQKEVDRIMGQEPITVEKIFKLKYIPAALRETLRLCSPITGISVEALEDTLLDDKYPVPKGACIAPIFSRAHLDPVVYGDDAREFKPERMLDENFARLQREHPNCWKPFGNGTRACIGRPFAWQEMLLAISLLLQNFTFSMHDARYRLRLSESLTIKPKDLYIRASLRHGMSPLDLDRRLNGNSSGSATAAIATGTSFINTRSDSQAKGQPISIFYGSNSGTCEALARQLAADASAHGFYPSIVDALDIARENLPADHPVVFITSSYEGEAPDNAAHFVSWLKNLAGRPLEKVAYAVFGVGNREWANTFHKIPKMVDSALAARGAARLSVIGLTDTSDRDTFTDFESWEDTSLWPALEERFLACKLVGEGTKLADLVVDVSAPRGSTLRQNLTEARVIAARGLTRPGVPQKRHIEIELPANISYCAGDYLCVMPMNPRETVARVLRRFKLSWDALLTIQGEKQVALPMNQPTSAWTILSAYVELSQPATKRNISTLAEFAMDWDTKNELASLTGARFQEEITKKRISILDLLERFPDVELPLGELLSMLPAMRIRQYSIASSPLRQPRQISISYSILDEPSFSGHGQHIGVATNYLSLLAPNDLIPVAIRASHVAFHLPATPDSTPIICIAAGAGVGPFRGFIEERSAQLAAGRTLAPALLLFGCRGRADDLYREEFDDYEKEGVVVVKRAYSRESSEEVAGCKYVQHRLLKEKNEVGELWERGAKLFVCGSRELGKAVEDACIELLMEFNAVDRERANELLEEVRNERFVTDVFT